MFPTLFYEKGFVHMAHEPFWIISDLVKNMVLKSILACSEYFYTLSNTKICTYKKLIAVEPLVLSTEFTWCEMVHKEVGGS